MTQRAIISIIISAILLYSCQNETKQELLTAKTNIRMVEDSLRVGYDRTVKRDIKNGIEYGIIKLEDSSKVKYWFQSHGSQQESLALFELPNGELMYLEGYFCCEVQLPKHGKFKNVTEFVVEMEKIDGIAP